MRSELARLMAAAAALDRAQLDAPDNSPLAIAIEERAEEIRRRIAEAQLQTTAAA